MLIESLLYATLNCRDAEALMLRITKNETMPPLVKIELVETVREATEIECIGTQTTEGTGKRIHRKVRRLITTSGETNEHTYSNQEADRKGICTP